MFNDVHPPGIVSHVLSHSHMTQEEDHNAHHHLQRPGGVRLGHALGSCDDAAVLLGPPSELGPGQDGLDEPVDLEPQNSNIGAEGPYGMILLFTQKVLYAIIFPFTNVI